MAMLLMSKKVSTRSLASDASTTGLALPRVIQWNRRAWCFLLKVSLGIRLFLKVHSATKAWPCSHCPRDRSTIKAKTFFRMDRLFSRSWHIRSCVCMKTHAITSSCGCIANGMVLCQDGVFKITPHEICQARGLAKENLKMYLRMPKKLEFSSLI